MKRNHIKATLNRVIIFLLTFSLGLVYAQPPVPGSGGGGAVGPGEPEETPIDMYNVGLISIAVLLIVGYSFYNKNKRVVKL